ncbi:cysteine--tRNA ligase [Roseitalea porphyridii]|uniref:Cysteine--tRNA ligase n=1 Tax=Roseitalea porphyridii TaxID=1852022 RepID=A0A4P6UYS9_9HYPH|nr:cysteine--tRNA ligase [Roseitalea porphyridii]QBK30257.1 cysteine--tRNA ligase [Roseitalea porphyridii]
MADQTPIQLYDTLTRAKRRFEPIDPDNVRLYVCGPTVYDYAHIGNARPVIVFDVLFRLLRHVYGADHVTYVRNITDVEDKINARALRDHPDLPLNEAIRAVTEKTADRFRADALALGCLPPTHEPRATEHIEDMIAMIGTLIDRGHAYVATGEEGAEVLFDVGSMPDYGMLSKRDLDEQQAGARVAIAAHKRNPADFVLWKQSGPDEPGWDADFGGTAIHGRPGWHIECSVMSAHHLGERFDIHGGGIDLVFPHHENEIAQSRCAHGTEVMANYWMHNGFLQVEGQKMSKSLGNFVTVHDLLETEKFGGRKWPGEVLRLAMLMTHYREPIDFSVRRLEEAESKLISYYRALATPLGDTFPDPEFLAHCSNDLNLQDAFARIDSLNKEINVTGGMPSIELKRRLTASLRLVGLLLEDSADDFMRQFVRTSDAPSEAEVEGMISVRSSFIRDKNWAEADRIRDELLEKGIQLKDGKDPNTGERVTTWEVKR